MIREVFVFSPYLCKVKPCLPAEDGLGERDPWGMAWGGISVTVGLFPPELG